MHGKLEKPHFHIASESEKESGTGRVIDKL